MLKPKTRRFSPRKCGYRATQSRALFGGRQPDRSPKADVRQTAQCFIYSLFLRFYPVIGCIMQRRYSCATSGSPARAGFACAGVIERNAHSVTAPASLTQRNLYLAALPDTHCTGTEQTRSGTHGGRENGKRPGG